METTRVFPPALTQDQEAANIRPLFCMNRMGTNSDQASDSGSDTNQRWRGLKPAARAALELRDYSAASPAEQLATTGLDVGRLISGRRELEAADAWIPGVEIVPRTIYQQRHRLPAEFQEMGRKRIQDMAQELLNEGVLVKGMASGSKEDKWLDVPTGPFARGVGEFVHGADEGEN